MGGYQQVPTIIETTQPSNGTGADQQMADEDHSSAIYLEEQKDAIDVKSYISQSRSDVGQYDYSPHEFSHFLRTGSYRSQCAHADFPFLTRAGSNRSRRGRSPNSEFVPTERSRSATVAVGQLERPKKSFENVYRLSGVFADDYGAAAHSVNSRKDSGIKSNSRRSSILQIETQAVHAEQCGGDANLEQTDSHHQHQQRVSGYYTSSQSSLSSPPARAPPLGQCLQSLRKQSDRQLIRCVQDQSASRSPHFMRPPLSKLSLFFADPDTERAYRDNVHSTLAAASRAESMQTLANSRFGTYFDVFISSVIFFAVSANLFLVRDASVLWICAFFCFALAQISAITLCFYARLAEVSEKVLFCCPNWYRWNGFGAVLVSLPLLAVLLNFACSSGSAVDYLYTDLLFIGVIHFCNFTQLNCWMKNALVTCFGLVYACLLLSVGRCQPQSSSASYNATSVGGNTASQRISHQIARCVMHDFELGVRSSQCVDSIGDVLKLILAKYRSRFRKSIQIL